MGMLSEFRAFAMRGNVIDLAVGVIIGAAFGKIVDSLVNDIIMPVISALLGGRLDFSNLFITLGAVPAGIPPTYDALKKAGVPLFAYGNFITVLINFALLAFVIFLLIKQVNRFRRSAEPASTGQRGVLEGDSRFAGSAALTLPQPCLVGPNAARGACVRVHAQPCTDLRGRVPSQCLTA